MKTYYGDDIPKLKALDVTYGDCIYGLQGHMNEYIKSQKYFTPVKGRVIRTESIKID